MNLSLIVCVLSETLNELVIYFLATLRIYDWICYHDKRNWTIINEIIWHNTQQCCGCVFNVMTALKDEKKRIDFSVSEYSIN